MNVNTSYKHDSLTINSESEESPTNKNCYEKPDFQSHEFILKLHNEPIHEFKKNKSFTDLLESAKEDSPELYHVLKVISNSSEVLEVLMHRKQDAPIPTPSFNALKAHAQRYNKKYGISIKIVAGIPAQLERSCKAFKTFLLEELKDPTHRTLGIVFDSEGVNGIDSHVVPLILRIDSSGPQALVLDVLGPDGSIYTTLAKSALESCNIDYSCCAQIRQYDFHSCRLGSIVTLRNALIDLKNNKDADEIFSSDYSFIIPAKWGFTDQIFRPQIERELLQQMLNPRQVASNEKNTHENISKSRKRYLKNLIFHYELKLPATSDTSKIRWEEITLPARVKIKEILNDNSVTLTWSETKRCNTYMLHKGYKLANLSMETDTKPIDKR